jgi:hypothetical protein
MRASRERSCLNLRSVTTSHAQGLPCPLAIAGRETYFRCALPVLRKSETSAPQSGKTPKACGNGQGNGVLGGFDCALRDWPDPIQSHSMLDFENSAFEMAVN